MQHPDEGLIHTWLDGELSADEAVSLEAHIAECAECSAKVAEARGLAAASSRIVSALDMVPSGVIPASSRRRRTWYQNTQLRAAAAVMVVAGASFLVMQNRDKSTMNRVMSTAAPRVDEAAPDTGASERDLSRESVRSADAVAPVPKPRSLASAAPSIPQMKNGTAARQEKTASQPVGPQANEAAALSGKVAGADIDIGTISLKRDSTQLSEVVVTGVAEVPAKGAEAGASVAPELRKIRGDTSGAMTRTIFQVSPNVEVTLTDIATAAFSQRTAQRRKAMADAPVQSPVQPPAPPVAAAASQANDSSARTINTISWIDKRGHMMTLTGPLPRKELEMLRKRLPEDQR